MYGSFDSTDRSPFDYSLFALGFAGFMTAVAGIILASPAIAIGGATILVLTVWSFRNRDGPG